MKKLLPKILFYYSAIASFLITISVVLTSQTLGPVIFAILFLPVTAYFIIEFFKQMHSLFSPKTTPGSDLGSPPKKGETIIMVVIFLILLGVGIRNVIVLPKNNQNSGTDQTPVPVSSPLIFKTQEEETKSRIVIKITDGSPFINIRGKPTVYSEKVGEAKDGDVYEYTNLEAGWYEIKLTDGKAGYITAKYVEEVSD